MSTPTAPAGWYDDGQHPGQQRYWDGERWTEHFHPPQVPPVPVPGGGPGPGRRPGRYWAWLAPVIVVVVAGGTVLGLALGGVFGGGDAPTSAVQRIVTAVNERDCVGYFSSMSQRMNMESGGLSRAATCTSEAEFFGPAQTRVTFRATQTIPTAAGATVLGVLSQSSGDSSYTECYAVQTVREDGRWRVDAIGSDGFPADVVLDSTAPGYCTGTPGLAE